ncbi:MAG: cupin domain-containing protein, partial [Chitinophagaceae bacterium]
MNPAALPLSSSAAACPVSIAGSPSSGYCSLPCKSPLLQLKTERLDKPGLCKGILPHFWEAGWGLKNLLALLFLIPMGVTAQSDSVLSGVYKWKEPDIINKNKIASTVLFEGKVHDFKWIQMNANVIATGKKKFKKSVPAKDEHLLIIKSGMLTISKDDSAWSVEKGSIALLMPGQKYSLKCEGKEPCNYYVMKYRSRNKVNNARGKNAGGSLVKNFNAVPFKPNNNGGGRRDYFDRATAMTTRFEMHVTTLKEAIRSHDPHTHRAGEIVLMIEGNTEIQIGDKFFKGNAGDIFYLGTDVLHAIRNEGTKPCMYFAFQFETP